MMEIKLLGNVAENAHAVSTAVLGEEDLDYLCHLPDPFKPKCILCLKLFRRSKLKNCFCIFPGYVTSGRRGLCSVVSMEACCQELGTACELP